MKNARLRSDIEGKLISKINEIVSELKVEGHAITKSVEEASKKIAKHIAKKLKEFEKKNVPEKEASPVSVIKRAPQKSVKPKIEKPVADKPVADKPVAPIKPAVAKPVVKKPATLKAEVKKPLISPKPVVKKTTKVPAKAAVKKGAKKVVSVPKK